MGFNDRIGNKAEEFGGKAKETAGRATGDEELREEGRTDKNKAGLKDAASKMKNAAGDAADKVKDTFKKN